MARCHRGTNSKGRKTIIKQTVLNIGPLSRFDDGQADYIGRLRQSLRQNDGYFIPPVQKADEFNELMGYYQIATSEPTS